MSSQAFEASCEVGLARKREAPCTAGSSSCCTRNQASSSEIRRDRCASKHLGHPWGMQNIIGTQVHLVSGIHLPAVPRTMWVFSSVSTAKGILKLQLDSLCCH